MFKVMLVDDDYPVLAFLKDAIPWRELGMELHSACKNGLVALEAAKLEPPDVVITDIGMPQMDGIALITELKRLKPDIRCIILSCMGDFTYAQQAVRLQVDDYVLKETMRPEQIIQLLRRFGEEMLRDNAHSVEIARWKSVTEENAILLRESLLRRMVVPSPVKEPEWTAEAARFGITFEGKEYLPVLCCVNRYAELRERSDSDQAILYAVAETARELLTAQNGAELLPANGKEYLFLFPYRRTLKENVFTVFGPLIRELGERLKRDHGISATFLYDLTVADPVALGRQAARLLGTRQERFYLKEGAICTLSSLPPFSEEDVYADYPEALQQIRDAFIEEDEPRLQAVVHDWMAQIEERRYPPELVKEWALKILYDNQSRFLSLPHYQTMFSLDVLHRKLADIDTIGELTEWMLKFFQERLPLLAMIYRQTRRSEIHRAQQYVNKNIGKKITLEEVADLLHINSSYFSRLFKKETGHNFIHYVTLVKMERAKEMLAKTNVSVEEVAEKLGYDNKSYFTKLFKKHTGDTPSDYRGP